MTPYEKAVLERLREASYTNADGSKVLYSSGGDSYRDAADLYAILSENHTTGSSNLENDQVRQILTDLRAGKDLDNAEWGVLKTLLAKYRTQLAALRASPDHQGQDYTAVAPEGTGRLIPASGS